MPITPKPSADTSNAALPVPNTRCPLIRAASISTTSDVSACFASEANTLPNPEGMAIAAPANAAVLRNPRRLISILLFSSMILCFIHYNLSLIHI
ncbi:MAG: hypothetical protein LUD40_03310, partial [Phocaeicola dorei]|nr:hypothetical protein [Phocaeicola dorei]